MGRRFILTVTIAISAALTVPVAALALRSESHTHSRPAPTTRTHDTSARAHDDDHASTSTPTNPDAIGSGDQVTVRIPSIVMLRVDGQGRIRAVATNSGRAPRVGDLVYLYGSDGSVRQSFDFRLAGRHWSGDFRVPGSFQSTAADAADWQVNDG